MPRHRQSILIVEGDRDMRTTLELDLAYGRIPDIQVFTAPDCKSAVLQLVILQPEVVILDLSFLGENRWNLLHQVRAQFDMSLIVLLDKEDKGSIRRSMELGADITLLKPIDFELLHIYIGLMFRDVKHREPTNLHEAASLSLIND